MAVDTPDGRANEAVAPTIHHQEPADGTAVMEMARRGERNRFKRLLKVLGPGLVSGFGGPADALRVSTGIVMVDDLPACRGTTRTKGISRLGTFWYLA